MWSTAQLQAQVAELVLEAVILSQRPQYHRSAPDTIRGKLGTEDSGLVPDAGVAWHPFQSADLVGPAAAFLLWPFQPTLSCWTSASGQ